jgi:hypothetical protein
MRSVGGLGRLIPKSTGGRVALGAAGVMGGIAGYSSIRNSRQRSRNTSALAQQLTAAAEARLQNVQLVPAHGQAI